MIKKAYMALTWSLYRMVIIVFTLLIALLQLLVIWVFNALNATSFLETVFNQLPLQMRVLFEQEFMPVFSVTGAAAFGLNHPLVLIAISIVAITIPARQIAGDSENGRLEMIMAIPLRRWTLIFSIWGSSALAILLVVCGGAAGSVTGLTITGYLNLTVLGNILKISVNLWLLFLLISSYTLLISVLSREGSRAALLAGGITFSLYLIYFISSIWSKLNFLKMLNIFNYYQPQELMLQDSSVFPSLGILLLLIILCIATAIYSFERRDIP